MTVKKGVPADNLLQLVRLTDNSFSCNRVGDQIIRPGWASNATNINKDITDNNDNDDIIIQDLLHRTPLRTQIQLYISADGCNI